MERGVERGEAKADHVGGSEIGDYLALNHGPADSEGVGVSDADVASPLGRVPGRRQLEAAGCQVIVEQLNEK